MITKKYIVWDWNGTIIDDVGIALDAVNDMLREKKRRKSHWSSIVRRWIRRFFVL